MSNEIIISHSTLHDIHRHVEHARVKHPWPGDMPPAEKFRIAERELNEMGAAMLKGDARGTRKEALDLIAVLVRLVEEDGVAAKKEGCSES